MKNLETVIVGILGHIVQVPCTDRLTNYHCIERVNKWKTLIATVRKKHAALFFVRVCEVCDVTTGKTRDRWDRERPEVDEPMKDGEKLCCVVYDCSIEEYRKQYWYRTTKIEKGGQTWTHTLFDKVILKFLATWREWSCCLTFRDLQQPVSICLLGHLYAVIKRSTGSYLLVFFCLLPQIRLLFATYSSFSLIIIIISPQTVTVLFLILW